MKPQENKLRKAIEKKEFILTAELGPPKGTDLTAFLKKGKLLASFFHGLNVTDNQSSVMRLSSLAGSIHLLKAGATPIFQMTCRDRNALGIQSDLLGAWSLGVENILAITGDHPKFGDHPFAKAVYDMDSVQLISTINSLNNGVDMAGKKLKGSTNFLVGGAVSPIAEPLEPEIIKFEKKIKAGANFFQTQAIFEEEKMADFMNYAGKFKVKIIAGVLVLKSSGMINFINKNVPGLDVPPDIEKAIKKSSNPEEEGIKVAGRMVASLKDIAHGVHIMAIGNEERVIDVLEEANL